MDNQQEIEKAATNVLKTGVETFADQEGSDIMDPATAEDPTNVQVAQEIAAWVALQNLRGAAGVGQQSTKISDANATLRRLIDYMASLDTKVLAKVVATAPERRPYGLSDKAWIYVLQNVRYRIDSNKQSQQSKPEPIQGELEAFLTPELKTKLRKRLPAYVVEDVIAVGDGDASTAGLASDVVGCAVLLSKTIRVTMMMETVAPTAPRDEFQRALVWIAEKLKELDEKFGILGVFMHATLQKTAIMDLTVPYVISIAPVLRCGGSAAPVIEAFDFVTDLDGKRTRQTPKLTKEEVLAQLETAAKNNTTVSQRLLQEAARFEELLQTDENGDRYIPLTIADKEVRLRVYPPQTRPSGADPKPFPPAAALEALAQPNKTAVIFVSDQPRSFDAEEQIVNGDQDVLPGDKPAE